MIKSTKHTTKYLRKAKQQKLNKFITEYRKIIQIVVNDIFTLKPLPLHLDYTPYINQTWFSKRILRRLTDQAITIIKSSRKSKHNIIPNCGKINPSLDTNNYNIRITNKKFNEFIALRCLGDKLKITIPIKHHRAYHKWNNKGQRISGIEINEKYIKINFEIEIQPKETGKIIGADQGITQVITLSNEQLIPSHNNHGYSLPDILKIMSRKKKGSKAFKAIQAHRNNFINWSINQLNLDNIKEIRLEAVKNLRYKKPSKGRFLSHWNYSLIRRKVIGFAQEHGVHVVEQASPFRSQRCSSCGLVKRSHRAGSDYSCSSCGLEINSDLNAAKNHELDLPELTRWDYLSKLSRSSGFIWSPDGVFDLDEVSLQSTFHLVESN